MNSTPNREDVPIYHLPAERFFGGSMRQLNRICFGLTILAAFLLFAALLLDRLRFPLEIKNDCAEFLLFGQLILEGKIPYVDFIEMNPPLIMYLNVIPAAMAKLAGVHPIVSFHYSIVALGLLSTVVCAWLLKIDRLNRNLAQPVLMVLSVPLVCVLLGEDFGQRESIFVLLYLPFFFERCMQQRGGAVPAGVKFAMGVAAGLGLCIKPFFFLIAGLVEGYWLIVEGHRRRRIDLGWCGCLLSALSYGACFYLLPHSAIDTFMNFIMPLSGSGYASFNCSLWSVASLENFRVVGVIWALSLLIAVKLRRQHSMLMPLCLWSIGAYAIFVWQQKGWNYQAIPLFFSIALLISVEIGVLAELVARGALCQTNPKSLAGEINERAPGAMSRYVAVVLCGLCGLLAVCCSYLGFRAWQSAQTKTLFRNRPELAASIERFSEVGDRILFLSESMEAFPTMLQFQRFPGSRYMSLFPLVFMEQSLTNTVKAESRRHIRSQELEFLSEVKQDIDSLRPQLIFLYGGHRYGPTEFQLGPFLQSHGQLARFLADYYCVGKGRDYEVYCRRSVSKG